jgi:hypothetical protein
MSQEHFQQPTNQPLTHALAEIRHAALSLRHFEAF